MRDTTIALCYTLWIRVIKSTSSKESTILVASFNSSLEWVLVTARHLIPAALAALTPAGESSITMQSLGSAPSLSAAKRYICGLGLLLTTSCPQTMQSKYPSMPSSLVTKSMFSFGAEETRASLKFPFLIASSSLITPGNGLISPLALVRKLDSFSWAMILISYSQSSSPKTCRVMKSFLVPKSLVKASSVNLTPLLAKVSCQAAK